MPLQQYHSLANTVGCFRLYEAATTVTVGFHFKACWRSWRRRRRRYPSFSFHYKLNFHIMHIFFFFLFLPSSVLLSIYFTIYLFIACSYLIYTKFNRVITSSQPIKSSEQERLRWHHLQAAAATALTPSLVLIYWSALIPKIRTLCMFGNLAMTNTRTATVLKKSIGCW